MRAILERLSGGATLLADESEAAFGIIMDGEAAPVEIAALVTALRVRGETVDEIVGAIRAMRGRMVRVDAPDDAIDVCGTGGDGANTRNISTAVTFVLAGMGIPVAKHGNRAASSTSGAADVLLQLGIGLQAPPEAFPAIIGHAGCGFLFAPNHHPALRFAADVRRALGFRTIFNMLGPLCNPAGVRRQLIGVYDPALSTRLAEALALLDAGHVWFAHSAGMDELSLAGPSYIVKLRNGVIESAIYEPEDAGLPRSPLSDLSGGDAADNAASLLRLLDCQAQSTQDNAYRNIVLVNSAAAAMVADRVADLQSGVILANTALESGAAKSALARLREATARWR